MSGKSVVTVVLALIIVIILVVRISGDDSEETVENIDITGQVGDGIDRAHAAKMIAVLGFGYDEMTGLEIPENYTDTGSGKWYDRYVAATCSMGIVWGNTEFRPSDYLTYSECEQVLGCLYGERQDMVNAAVSELKLNGGGSEYISRSEWISLYNRMLAGEFGGEHREVKQESLMLLAIMENTESSWQVATSEGAYHFDGYALDTYTNGIIDVYTDGSDIIYINGFSDGACEVRNAWIISCGNDEVEMFYSGVVTRMPYNQGVIPDAASYSGIVADIVLDKGSISSVTPKYDRRNDKILAMNDEYVETAMNGKLSFSPECKVYGIYDVVKNMGMGDIAIGYNVSDIVVDADQTVCAVLVTSQVNPVTVRVAIKTSSYKDYYHKKVTVSSDMGMTVVQNGISTPVEAGQSLEYGSDSPVLAAGRITVVPAENGHIEIDSIKRGYGKPKYRGNIELSLCDEGIVVVNELSIDEYLYAVVPSEMPVSYGVEALKVQAICARSYAYMHVMESGLAGIGAHVDDSTSYQVYNNSPETAESIEAVSQTSGQVLTYNGEIIPAYYYSTSCGITANGEDVWFGMKNAPYLSSRIQTAGEDSGAADYDTTDDEQFGQFLDRTDITTFDSGFPWYRWETDITGKDIKKSIEASLEKRYNTNPSLILTRDERGAYVSEPVSSIGSVKSIRVIKRAQGGIVTAVVIKGSKKTIKVKSEYNIRLLLAPVSSPVRRRDGSVVDNMSLLPSAFIVISSDKKGSNKIFHIKGGGYGHGVGMSQNGTKGMVAAGYGYKDILAHYYGGCEITYYGVDSAENGG